MSRHLVHPIAAALVLACAAACAEPAGPAVARPLPGYDVVVAGAGTGGTMAAIQAARMGADTLLVEETDWVGGQMCAAGVTSMDEGTSAMTERGLYREFVERAAAHYGPLGLSMDTCYWGSPHVAVEPRVGRRILTEMMGDAARAPGAGRLDLLLSATVTRLHMTGRRVTGADLRLEGEADAPTVPVAAAVVIDATELGDLLPLTGAPFRIGNAVVRGNEQPAKPAHIQDFTWTAIIRCHPGDTVPEAMRMATPPPGYDPADFSMTVNNSDVIRFMTPSPWPWEMFVSYRGMPDSTNPDRTIRNPNAKVTRTHVNVAANDVPVTSADLASPDALRDLEHRLKARTLGLLFHIQQGMTKPAPGWGPADDEGYDTPFNRRRNRELARKHPDLAPFLPLLDHFPVIPYARESRRIIGMETLRARDIDRLRGPRVFATSVAVGEYPVDLHGAHGADVLEPGLDRREDLGAIGFSADRIGPFTIPYGVLVPRDVDGFLAAEKNFSQSRLVNGATRLQPSTMLVGQAAGAAAALAARHGVEPRSLPPVLVQRALLDAGGELVALRGGAHKPAGVEPGSPLWKAAQLALAHGVADADEVAAAARPAADPRTLDALRVRLGLAATDAPGASTPGNLLVAWYGRVVESAEAGMKAER